MKESGDVAWVDMWLDWWLTVARMNFNSNGWYACMWT